MTDTETAVAAPRSLTDAVKDEIRGTYDALKKGLPGFRARRSQSQMIAASSKALATPGGVAVVEAPTGTGKSLSYLTAGVPIAQSHKLKLIVATGTVALQEQLADRDVPQFLETTKFPMKSLLAKGRQRFLCPRNSFALAEHGPQDSISFGNDDDDLATPAWPRQPRPGEVDLVARLNRAWHEKKWDGDLDKSPEAFDPELRSIMSCSAGACSNKRCDYVDRCPFKLARKTMDDVDIVLVNHALLISDLSVPGQEEDTFGGAVLPKLAECIVVIDEGHNLAETAREMLAASVQTSAAHKALLKLRKLLRASYEATGKDKIGRRSLTEGLQLLAVLDDAWSRFDKQVKLEWVPEAGGRDGPMWRAHRGLLPEAWEPLVRDLQRSAGEAYGWVHSVRRAVLDEDDLPAGAKETLPRELGIGLERLNQQSRLWDLWAKSTPADAPPVARWITLDDTSTLVFHAGAVSAADFLSERLFGQAAAVLVTSATISAGGDFSAVLRDLGLPPETDTFCLASPFDLEGNGKLVVPPIKASVKDREAHATEGAEWLAKNLDWNAGNLVIFTSRAKMDDVYRRLPLAKQAHVRMQGSKSKSKLLEDHAAAIAKGKGSTIFGLQSFGEGVDLKGDLCVSVTIDSLPFAPPTDPVLATLSEWMEHRGQRPFDEISVPEATRKLTQYMGRLLRHEDDKGTINVLDRRLADARYGRRMLQALPPFTRVLR